MRRLLSAAVLAALVAVPGAGLAKEGGGRDVAFVSAEDEDSVVAVEVRSGRVLRRLHVPNGPHNVASARSPADLVLVTSPPAGRVTLIDARRMKVARVLRLEGYPHDVEVASDGRYAYVTLERAGAVAVVSLTNRRVVRRVPVGGAPHDLAVSPVGDEVWVTHGPGARSLTLLDTRRPSRARILGRVAAQGAHDISFACGRVWVTYWNSGWVGAFNQLGRLVLRRRVGNLVHHVQGGRGGRRVWFTDHVGDRASLFDACSGRRLGSFAVGAGPHHVAPATNSTRVVVASHDSGTITIIHRFVRRWHVRSVAVGRGLHGVAVAFVPFAETE
jgi:YVTN family beta-propeller protein